MMEPLMQEAPALPTSPVTVSTAQIEKVPHERDTERQKKHITITIEGFMAISFII
jgi:hypothetical protein